MQTQLYPSIDDAHAAALCNQQGLV